MALKEQQDLLARLYTDPTFAGIFFDDPHSVVADSAISINEAKDISVSAKEEIRIFADSLIWKRLREVEKLLPVTRKVIGDFQNRFKEHAEAFNPTSVNKHLEDATAFQKYLEQSETIDQIAKDVVKLETARLRHFAKGRQLTSCWLGHDVRPLFNCGNKIGTENIEKRRSVAVWARFRNRTRFFFI